MNAELEVSFGSSTVRVRNKTDDRDIHFHWPVRGGKKPHLTLPPLSGWAPIYGTSLMDVRIWTEPTRSPSLLDDGLGGW